MTTDSENLLLKQLQSVSLTEREAVLRQAGPPAEVVPRLVEAASALTWVDARRAMDATEVALDIADQFGSAIDRSRARWGRGRALAHAGQFNESINVCREGISTAEQAGLAIEAARLRVVLMQPLAELGLLNEAIAVGQTARKIFVEQGEQSLAARADINLGIANLRHDDPAAAVVCFERARPHLANEPLVLGHLENSRGEALWTLGKLREAEDSFKAAHDAFGAAKATLPMAIAEGNLADLAARAGQLQKAMYHFERARRQLESDEAPGQLARLLAEQAEALNALGLPRAALNVYEKVLPQLHKCGLVYESARARAGMGMALIRLGQAAEAETCLAAAAKSFDELGNETLRAKVELQRASLLGASGQRAAARSITLHALAQLHDRIPEAVTARLLLGRILLEDGSLGQADAEIAAGLAAVNDLDIAPLTAELLITRGMIRREQQKLPEAIESFTAAIAQIERIRGSLQAERFRIGYHAKHSRAYESLLTCLLDLENAESEAQAFGVAEQAKSRVLLDQVRHAVEQVPADGSRGDGSFVNELWSKMTYLQAELNALYSRLHDVQTPKANHHSSWKAAIAQREREFEELESRLRTLRGIGDLYAETVSAEKVREKLQSDQALIEYFIANDELLAFVVSSDGVRAFRRLVRLGELTQHIQRFQFQVNRALRPGALEGSRKSRLRDDANHELFELYRMIVAPFRGELKTFDRLIIVPHGPLHLLPFHALWDGQQHLVESFTVQYAPSASLWAHLREQNEFASSGDPRFALFVGVADAAAPQIAEEVRTLANCIDVVERAVLVGEQATVDAVIDASKHADLIHLACHGAFSADSPLGSGLRLADRWLTVRDIYGLRLRAHLVTLSGCETGVNLVTAGDELMGLVRAFFAAGAESLLVSLWRVDDAVTREFMTDFYRSLNTTSGSKRTKADIHAQTQRKFLGMYQHPALWAPFILEGRE